LLALFHKLLRSGIIEAINWLLRNT
jgi:hypothetical protein